MCIGVTSDRRPVSRVGIVQHGIGYRHKIFNRAGYHQALGCVGLLPSCLCWHCGLRRDVGCDRFTPRFLSPLDEQFDIDRLLNYANKKMEERNRSEEESGANPANTSTKAELKYFDPLSSPSGDGEEMSRMELELERRAKEPRMLRRLQQPQNTAQYPYKRPPPPPPSSADRSLR